MKQDKPLSKDDLVKFFGLKPVENGDYRALSRVLKALGIRLVGGTTRWSVVWKAFGFAEVQTPERAAELRKALLDARATAELLGVDPSTLYRWSKGQVPIGMPPFPKAIDLSNGGANTRSQRWRRAEVLAWHCHRDFPIYARQSPVFGGLTPAE
ncbi:hypothetical protein T8A63_20585 (plasmid) [Sulfitobacter sp. OXR-159]|jgi:predicted DNA-binding transcriptional regulator AlpA|uniref:helix-turn-helix transcriptional regulator n=1 Tax=Sulfitobacter sp. OXR-159 TaxID=3100174 RepID=UPI002AC9A25B|nr:hypothetical protein [Sulfitobacter sp. OXR-159]WPZ31724.1 hypothetical protein T8A63_20585 [Sulfitobacter sp. OXR-159]